MPVPAYVTIPDAWVDPESPINSALMTALRDNLLSIVGGGAGAPSLTPSLLSLGGSGADGALTNATTITNPGFYDWTTGVITAIKTFPIFSVNRFTGNVTISANLTVTPLALTDAGTVTALGGSEGNSAAGTTGGADGAGGGGSIGAGGDGIGTTTSGVGAAGTSETAGGKAWLRHRRAGGQGGRASGNGGGNGGGVIVFLVDGNVTLSSCTINASGNGGAGAGTSAAGGGAGGTVIIIATGTITDGTILASGGNGKNEGSNDGGGGGGGYAAMVASAYTGTQTITAAGGSGPGGAGNGAAGVTEKVTLTRGQLNALFIR